MNDGLYSMVTSQKIWCRVIGGLRTRATNDPCHQFFKKKDDGYSVTSMADYKGKLEIPKELM